METDPPSDTPSPLSRFFGFFLSRAGLALLLIGLILAAGLWSAQRYGRPAYRRYRENRSLQQATNFLAKKDFRNASISARQALQRNPRNPRAWRILAELAEMAGAPQALDLRRRMVELEPTVENKLAYAAVALRSQPPPYSLATEALHELRESGSTNATGFHMLSAELALKAGQTEEAAACFESAIRLEPTNKLHQLNLSVLRLQSTNEGVAARARESLEALRADTNLAPVALRWLVNDRVRRKDLREAEALSKRLLAEPGNTLDDRLTYLGILREAKAPDFASQLGRVKSDATTNALQLYTVSAWLISRGMAEDAWNWLTNTPAKILAEQPAPLALVDCFVARKDWAGLEAFLEKEKWGEMEFLRYAFLSRAALERKQTLAADTRWKSAVREAGDRLGSLNALLGMATGLGRNEAREELLWNIVQRFPRERWALRELDRFYTSAGNTRGLNRVYTTMATYDSKNALVQNNLAATSMLLQQDLPKAHELAREAYGKHPDQAVIASTYAYSLHLQNRTREGLAVMEKLKPEALETPSVALYYGVLLSAAGDTVKAGKYFEIAGKASLLPEEQALLRAAKAL
jgi:Tfp pilus assembly protein PilF